MFIKSFTIQMMMLKKFHNHIFIFLFLIEFNIIIITSWIFSSNSLNISIHLFIFPMCSFFIFSKHSNVLIFFFVWSIFFSSILFYSSHLALFFVFHLVLYFQVNLSFPLLFPFSLFFSSFFVKVLHVPVCFNRIHNNKNKNKKIHITNLSNNHHKFLSHKKLFSSLSSSFLSLSVHTPLSHAYTTNFIIFSTYAEPKDYLYYIGYNVLLWQLPTVILFRALNFHWNFIAFQLFFLSLFHFLLVHFQS